MKPDATWKESQRSVLLSQINISDEELDSNSYFGDISRVSFDFIHSFSQPVMASFLVAFLFLTGGFVGLRASQDTKPGDSLYLAKIVGEKTQLALAFTDKKKAELGLGFAARRAEEIKQVIATESVEIDDKDEKVDQLIKDFKKEINAAKSRIEKISEDSGISEVEEANEIEVNEEQGTDKEINNSEDLEIVDGQIFSAGSSKTDQGLQISHNSEKIEEDREKVVKQTIEIDIVATTTEAIKSSTTEDTLMTETAGSILEQASVLLEAEKYDEIFDILDDVNEVVTQSIDNDEVKGVEESVDSVEVGTSTKE